MNRPRALLLDEPLGALDLRLRKQLQIELKRIQQDVGITFVHVTHDQEEAMSMADTIAVMNGGRIEQAGSATELYERPRTAFVANFLGISNLIDGDGRPRDARDVDDPRRRASCTRPPSARRRHRATSRSACGRRRSRCSRPASRVPDGRNVLRGKVVVAAFLGVSIQYVDPGRGRRGAQRVRAEHGERASAEPEVAGRGPATVVSARCHGSPEHTFVVERG